MKYLKWGLIILVIAGVGVAAYIFLVPGKVNLTINPGGARVIVEGREYSGSEEISLGFGRHIIEIEKTGYATTKTEVNILGGQKIDLNIDLIALPKGGVVLDRVTTIEAGGDNHTLLVSGGDGKGFQKYDTETKKTTPISKLDFGQAIKVVWSPSRYLAYLWRGDGTAGLADLKRYDLVNQEFNLWGSGYLGLGWSPDGSEIIYIYKPGTGEFTMKRAKPGNFDKEIVADLRGQGISNPSLKWTPDGKRVAVIDKDIYVLTFYTHELKKITKRGNVTFGKMSPDGKYIIFSNKEGLYRSNLQGEMTPLGRPVEIFDWMGYNDSRNIAAYRNGRLSNIDILNGRETEYSYIGEKIDKPDEIAVINGKAYLLINNQVREIQLVGKENWLVNEIN